MEENKEEIKVVRQIGNLKKIDNILDTDRLIKIYGLLPTEETKLEFLDILVDTYGSRLVEKFEERLETEFEENGFQAKQGYLKENIKNIRDIIDVFRSRRRQPLNEGITERINYLVSQLKSGNYISKEDQRFLAKNLAGRSDFFWGDTPSEKREEIRRTIDTYVKTKNEELANDASMRRNYQFLEEEILRHQHWLDLAIKKDDEEEIKKNKRIIERLEEQKRVYEKRHLNLRTMVHDVDPNFDFDKNNLDLEKLLNILESENLGFIKEGIKLPDTGINENDVIREHSDGSTVFIERVDDEDRNQIVSRDAEYKKFYNLREEQRMQDQSIRKEQLEQVVMSDYEVAERSVRK